MERLVVKKSVEVNAPASKVWDVVSSPGTWKRWMLVAPEVEGDGHLKLRSKVLWKDEKGTAYISRERSRLSGPQSSLKGCTVEDECFLATGVKIFQGACVGRRTEVRSDAVVHVRSVLPPNSVVPIKWVAVGDPAQLFSPDKHEEIDAILGRMNFSQQVYGLERLSGSGVDVDMKELTRRVTTGLAGHRDDREL